MKILTVENESYDLDTLPEEIDDIRYCVLDASEKNDADFFFLPLIFLESFYSPAICMTIGNQNVQMPMDWSILICDDELSSAEIIPLTSLNNRGFKALTMNPMTCRTPDALDISITNIYQEVKWYVPRLKSGHLLAVPLGDGDKPACVYFVKEANKTNDINIGDLL